MAGRSAGSSAVTVLLMNLMSSGTANVTLTGLAGCDGSGCPRTEYRLTGPRGTDSSLVALNGRPLQLDSGTGLLPPMPGRAVATAGSSNVVQLAPASIAFLVVPGAGAGAGCP